MERPVSVTRATQVLTGLVVLSGVTALLTVILNDQVIRAWARGHSAGTRSELRTGGLEAVRQGAIQVPNFVAPALSLFVVFAALAWVLVVFIRAGHEWARLTLAGLIVLMAIATGGGMRTSPPTVFLVLSWISIGFEAVLLFFLAHKDTTAYIRGTWRAPQDVTQDA
ncbi:hypothetical protein [Nocardioides sp.]|jgi:hypothetical protein|uniref:hypothetical protein n=1 Tax=Nocardioides sp. TaxID=35761 RepID=UPI0031FE4708|nr:hypothetical protein [Nocardioides sp.]